MHRIIRARWFVTLAAIAVVAVACSSAEPTPTSTPVPPTNTPVPTSTPTPESQVEARNFQLVSGWYKDQQVRYYDFGTESPAGDGSVSVAPIWAFITGMDSDGNPMFVEGQHNVVNVVPGDPGYSDLWQVNLVTVPEGYVADSIKSFDDLMASGFEITPTSIFVNCPVVPAGSTLETGQELVQGWYKGEEVFYPDFGPNPAATLPIWAFITGFDGDGNPQFVESQNNVIDLVPGDDGYSAFWEVNLVIVPEGYVANSVTSRADVEAMGWEIVKPGIVVNCPVVDFPGA